MSGMQEQEDAWYRRHEGRYIMYVKKIILFCAYPCHYPDQIPWYYMCDNAGIYVMAETNLESHGSFQKLGAIEPSMQCTGIYSTVERCSA